MSNKKDIASGGNAARLTVVVTTMKVITMTVLLQKLNVNRKVIRSYYHLIKKLISPTIKWTCVGVAGQGSLSVYINNLSADFLGIWQHSYFRKSDDVDNCLQK